MPGSTGKFTPSCWTLMICSFNNMIFKGLLGLKFFYLWLIGPRSQMLCFLVPEVFFFFFNKMNTYYEIDQESRIGKVFALDLAIL